MVEGLLCPSVMCHSHCVCVCVSCASQPRDGTFVQRCVQKYHNVHVCSVAYVWPWWEKFCLRWTPRAGKGGILLPGPAQRFDVRGDPSFSAVWRTYLQMGMGSILQSQISSVYKGTSFTPADRRERGKIQFRLAGGSVHS